MRGAVLRRELTAIGLSLLAVFLFGALVFQHVPESGRCLDASGVFGPAGTLARCVLVEAVGIPGAAIVALACLVISLRLFGRMHREGHAPEWGLLFAGVVALLPIAIGLTLGGEPTDNPSTGLWGSFVAHYLRKGLGPAGAWIVFLLCTSVLTVATLRWNPIRMIVGPGRPRGEHGAGETTASSVTLAEPRPEPSPQSHFPEMSGDGRMYVISLLKPSSSRA